MAATSLTMLHLRTTELTCLAPTASCAANTHNKENAVCLPASLSLSVVVYLCLCAAVCLCVPLSASVCPLSVRLSGSVWVCLGLSGSVSHVRVVHVCVRPTLLHPKPRTSSLFTFHHTPHPSPQNAAGAMDGMDDRG